MHILLLPENLMRLCASSADIVRVRNLQAVSSLIRMCASPVSFSARYRCHELLSFFRIQLPPDSPLISMSIPVPSGACRFPYQYGTARISVSMTGAHSALEAIPAAPTASRICCWWCQRSVYSRAISNQFEERASPAQATENNASSVKSRFTI